MYTKFNLMLAVMNYALNILLIYAFSRILMSILIDRNFGSLSVPLNCDDELDISVIGYIDSTKWVTSYEMQT